MGVTLGNFRMAVAAAALGFAFIASRADGLKGQLFLAPGAHACRLLVKFRPEAGPDLDDSGGLAFRLKSRSFSASSKTSAAAFALGLRYRRAVPFHPAEIARLRAGDFGHPQRSGERFDIARMAGLLEIDLPGADPERLLEIGRRLESLDDVEYCSLQPLVGLPPPVDLAPPTPDYTSRQNWLGPSPGSDCRYGWTLNADGRGVTLRDIEDSWGNLTQGSTHEDFDGADVAYALPAFNTTYDDHGTAIFGMIIGQHNGYGIDGCAPKATLRAYSFQRATGNQDRPGTLTRMVADSKPGDIILLEMQAGGLIGEQGVPADVDASIWDLVKQATTAGVVVIGTAGNGSGNLDGTAYAAYRARGDNGAIMEGAGSGNLSHTHLSFSSYGRCCVNVQGWGENVVTTGYGTLANLSADGRQKYIATFNGTSSGGGHIAGIVCAVQSYALQRLGKPLTPSQMRGLLIATGHPQGADSATAHIGPLPDIHAALDSVDRMAKAVALAEGRPGSTSNWNFSGGRLSGRGLPGAEAELTLLDGAGRRRFATRARFGAAGNTDLEVPHLTPGLYWLRVGSGSARETHRLAILP